MGVPGPVWVSRSFCSFLSMSQAPRRRSDAFSFRILSAVDRDATIAPTERQSRARSRRPSLTVRCRLPEKVRAAIKVGPSTTELRELDLPTMPDTAALLKVEVAGVCGTDVSQYRLPLRGGPIVMGHENVGRLARVGKTFAAHKGLSDGDLVFLEHYLP